MERSGARRIIIDTDPGMGTKGADPEDGMALLYALQSPGVTVEGITLVAGNVPTSESWPNAQRLLALAGRTDVPLHAGASRPSRPADRPIQCGWLSAREDADAVPPDTAAEFIAAKVLADPGAVTVVAIGPLTNVAAALSVDPAVAEALAGIVIMGGTVAVPGNITPAAEFNIWMDPDAAAAVFDCGAPITMVGLDVCHQTRFDRPRVEAVRAAGSPLATFMADACDAWIDVRAGLFGDGEDLHLYDSLAMAAAIEPGLVSTVPALVEVETSAGPAQGMTVTHRNEALRRLLTGKEPNAEVAVGVDVDEFSERFGRVMPTQA